MQILKAHSQRRATLRERTSQSLLRTIALDRKYNQKHAAAEKNRSGLEEAEKKKEHARFSQLRKVATTVSQPQETERRKLSESLIDKLQSVCMCFYLPTFFNTNLVALLHLLKKCTLTYLMV